MRELTPEIDSILKAYVDHKLKQSYGVQAIKETERLVTYNYYKTLYLQSDWNIPVEEMNND